MGHQRSVIERCTVLWVEEYGNTVHDMRWQSRDARNRAGDAEKTLGYGRTYLVPIAARRESISEKQSLRTGDCDRTGEKFLCRRIEIRG